MNKRKRSPTRSQFVQKYKVEWEKELKWLRKGKCDVSALCTVCNSELQTGMGGLKDLRRHATTEYHKKNERAKNQSNTMKSFVIQEDNSSVDAALYWANFVTENNLSMKLSDNFCKLVPKMFPDSQVASKFHCGRTKTSQLIEQALGDSFKEDVVQKMKDSFFTLLLDESTDKATLRQMVIMCRAFGEDKVETYLYSVVAFDGAATGENLFNIVNKEFEDDGVPWKNCVSMSSDGAKAMVGEFNSVLSRVKKQQNSVWFLHCTCHVAHLAASHACHELPDVCEQLTRDVYSFFKTSGKRQSEFREIQVSLKMETLKLLRPCFTRWLAMSECVTRILHQWPALQLYFEEKIDEREGRLESVQRIKDTLNSKYCQLYFFFLEAILPRFTRFNTMFQHERPFVHKMHKEIGSLLRQFLASFVQFSVLQKSDFLNAEVDYSFKNQLSDASLFIGQRARNLLEEDSASATPTITAENKKDFFTNVRDFFEMGTKEMYRLLPYRDDVLKNITIFDPAQKTSGNWEKIEGLAKRFPNIISMDEMDDLNTEFTAYSFWDLPETISITDDIDVYWSKVAQCSEYPTLCKLAKSMLILPHSNAQVERVFSNLTLIKTSHRTSLSSPMLNALMLCSDRKKMVDFKPTDKMRRRARHLKKKPTNPNDDE